MKKNSLSLRLALRGRQPEKFLTKPRHCLLWISGSKLWLQGGIRNAPFAFSIPEPTINFPHNSGGLYPPFNGWHRACAVTVVNRVNRQLKEEGNEHAKFICLCHGDGSPMRVRLVSPFSRLFIFAMDGVGLGQPDAGRTRGVPLIIRLPSQVRNDYGEDYPSGSPDLSARCSRG